MTGERSTRTSTRPALSAIVEQLIDGPGFVLIPNLIDASEAAQARSRALEIAASPSASAFGKRNDRTGQHTRSRVARAQRDIRAYGAASCAYRNSRGDAWR